MLGDDGELLIHGERELDGAAHQQGERRHQRLELDIDLGAEAAAQQRHPHAHPVLRPAQQARDLAAHEGRHLRGGVDGERAVARLGHRHERLERQVHGLLGVEHMLEDMRRLGEGRVERHIGVAPPGEMFQVRKSPGGLEHVMHDRPRGQRLDLVIDRGKLVIVGGDQLHRLLGHVRVGGQHHGDRLAHMADLLMRQDRLVVEGRAVIGMRDERENVVDGDDAGDAGQRARRGGVDAADAAMRYGAAKDLAIKHAGKTQVVHIFGAPGDLLARLQPRDALADLGCHDECPPIYSPRTPRRRVGKGAERAVPTR